MDRLRAEQLLHDAQARSRWADLVRHPENLAVNDEWYLRHETWILPAFRLLGDDLHGLSVLDYGCGHGMASVVLARRGANVTAFDLSAAYVAEATARAQVNEVADRLSCLQAVAERLPFTDACFNRIWGNAILHHLDLPQAVRELARVLKPDGVAVFCEPWGGNPLLDWARRRLPYPGKQRSHHEEPLCDQDVRLLHTHFADVRLYPFQLLAMVGRLWPALPFRPALEHVDAALFRHWPSSRRFCRYVVLSLRRPYSL
jgi:SAM-dependent methyltransferase